MISKIISVLSETTTNENKDKTEVNSNSKNKADYASFTELEHLGHPYLGSYPVELDGLTDDNLHTIDTCQMTNCTEPINNSCIVDLAEKDPIASDKEVYHVCEAHSGQDIMRDKVYEECERCNDYYDTDEIPYHRSLRINFCPECFSELSGKEVDSMIIELRMGSSLKDRTPNEDIKKVKEWEQKAISNFEKES